MARAASRGWRPWQWPATKRRRTQRTCPLSVSSTLPPRRSSSEPVRRKGAGARLLASRRRMTSLRSEMEGFCATRMAELAAGDEPLEERQGNGLGATANLVHATEAGWAARGARAGLEDLESTREQVGQHLEDALGQPDAAGLVVVEIDGGRELVALDEQGAHDLARDHFALGIRGAVTEPGPDVTDVAQEEDRGQRVEQPREGPEPIHQLVAVRGDLREQGGGHGQPCRRRLHLLLGQLDLAGAHVLQRAHLDLLEAHDLF